MALFNLLVARVAADSADADFSERNNLIFAALAIIFLALVLTSCLFFIRHSRQRRNALNTDGLPLYQDLPRQGGRNNNALTIQTTDKHGRSSVVVIGRDGQPMLANPMSPPHSPDNVPQIRITFPDEQDEAGRMKNGRVVVVRVGDSTVGLEPVNEEQLPAYEKESKSQFYSVDMDQIGGLKEKDRSTYQ